MTEEKAKRIIEQTKIEPFIELSIQVQKIRRNLLLCSVLCLAVFFGGEIKTNPNGMGMAVSGLPLKYQAHALLGVTIYFWIYYIWSGWQTFYKWKLRRTAHSRIDKLTDQGLANTTETDYSFAQETVVRFLKNAYGNIIREVEGLEGQLADKTQSTQNPTLADRIDRLNRNIREFEKNSEQAKKFSISFWSYQKSLIVDWLIEYWLPIILGIIAIIAVFAHLKYGPIDWPWINIK